MKVQLFVDNEQVFNSESLPEQVFNEPCDPFFTLSEFFTGCTVAERSNMPLKYYDNILKLAQILQVIRYHFRVPLYVNSCYRDVAHNKRVGGVSTSQHLTASAVDFTCHGVELPFIVDYIRKHCQFGQLIYYENKKFLHLSLPSGSDKTLNQYIIKS